MGYIKCRGKRQEVIQSLADGLGCTMELGGTVLDFIEAHPALLSDDEDFECCRGAQEEGRLNFVSNDAKYYIGIKLSTICIIVNLLGVGVMKFAGFNETAGAAVIFASQLVNAQMAPKLVGFPLDEVEGEKCILLEAIKKKEKITDRLLEPFGGECVNNMYNCRYNSEGQCNCKRADVSKILQFLEKKGALKAHWNGYRYIW